LSKKLTKEELKEPDLFISSSEKFLQWIEAHARIILSTTGLVVVVSLGWLGHGYWQSYQEQQALTALYPVEGALKKVEEEKAKPDAPKADFASTYAPLIGPIKTVIQQHASTKAAMVSALNLSSFLLDQKQTQEALQVLKLVRFQPQKQNVLNGFWSLHLGLAYLENKELDQALKAYQGLLEVPDQKPFHPEALLKQGLTWELKGDREKAKSSYERLSREFPESESAKAAQQQLRFMDLKSEQG